MKFKYKRYHQEILRPVIPVRIKFGNIVLPYEVLIDSGADMCIFNAQIADILGLNTLSGERRSVMGITGVSEYYYVHRIALEVGGISYKTEIGFLSHIASVGYGIVGQSGFFDKFKITFDLKKEEIEIKPK